MDWLTNWTRHFSRIPSLPHPTRVWRSASTRSAVPVQPPGGASVLASRPANAVVSTARYLAVFAKPAGRRCSREGRVPPASHSPPDESEIRILEIRRKPELRNRKQLTRIREPADNASSPVIIRPSDFGFLSALGFRPSEFAYRWGERPREPEQLWNQNHGVRMKRSSWISQLE